MSKAISEHTLEFAIVADLVKGHYVQRPSSAFNKAPCLDPGRSSTSSRPPSRRNGRSSCSQRFLEPFPCGTFSMLDDW